MFATQHTLIHARRKAASPAAKAAAPAAPAAPAAAAAAPITRATANSPVYSVAMRPPPLAGGPALSVMAWNVAGLRGLLKRVRRVMGGDCVVLARQPNAAACLLP
jgi:hypothetical protein